MEASVVRSVVNSVNPARKPALPFLTERGGGTAGQASIASWSSGVTSVPDIWGLCLLPGSPYFISHFVSFCSL